VFANTWVKMADTAEGRRLFAALCIGSAIPPTEQILFDLLIAKASG
jgi:hypothetical protein